VINTKRDGRGGEKKGPLRIEGFGDGSGKFPKILQRPGTNEE